MTDVYVDLRNRGVHNLEPVSAGLQQLIGGNDSMYVIVSRLDAANSDPIAALLREAGLTVQTKGGQAEEFIIRGYYRH